MIWTPPALLLAAWLGTEMWSAAGKVTVDPGFVLRTNRFVTVTNVLTNTFGTAPVAVVDVSDYLNDAAKSAVVLLEAVFKRQGTRTILETGLADSNERVREYEQLLRDNSDDVKHALSDYENQVVRCGIFRPETLSNAFERICAHWEATENEKRIDALHLMRRHLVDHVQAHRADPRQWEQDFVALVARPRPAGARERIPSPSL